MLAAFQSSKSISGWGYPAVILLHHIWKPYIDVPDLVITA